MTNRLTKINQLNNIESFIQVNLFKGYTFIDKAGEIINSFYRGQNAPIVPLISPNGMVIKKFDEITEELRVSPGDVWAHYLKPNSLDQIATSYLKNLKAITSIVNVDGVLRIGWRNYFVYEYGTIQDREQSFKKLTIDQSMKTALAAYSLDLKGVEVTISITRAAKKEEPQTPAVLIDIDAFIVHKEPCKLTEAEAEITEIRKVIQSAELLEKINLLIK